MLLHDDGVTQWTLTRSEDLARGFVQLFGLSQALGEAYHITDNVAHSWQHIFASIAQMAGTDLQTCSVPSTTLVEHIDCCADLCLAIKPIAYCSTIQKLLRPPVDGAVRLL